MGSSKVIFLDVLLLAVAIYQLAPLPENKLGEVAKEQELEVSTQEVGTTEEDEEVEEEVDNKSISAMLRNLVEDGFDLESRKVMVGDNNRRRMVEGDNNRRRMVEGDNNKRRMVGFGDNNRRRMVGLEGDNNRRRMVGFGDNNRRRMVGLEGDNNRRRMVGDNNRRRN